MSKPILAGEAKPLGIRVVATDLDTGETAERVIQPGNYIFVTASPCYIATEQHYATGTSVITLKGRSAHLLTTVIQEPSDA